MRKNGSLTRKNLKLIRIEKEDDGDEVHEEHYSVTLAREEFMPVELTIHQVPRQYLADYINMDSATLELDVI